MKRRASFGYLGLLPGPKAGRVPALVLGLALGLLTPSVGAQSTLADPSRQPSTMQMAETAEAIQAAETVQTPSRLVALAPHIVEMVYLLGAGERIVATVAYADHPPAARAIPRLGDAFTLSLEALVSADADLVLAWGGALDDDRRARLERLVPALWVSSPEDLADVAGELDALALRLGTGEAAAAAFRARLSALRGPVRAAPLRVLPLVSLDPVMTLTDRSFVADVLARCGARNPFGTLPGVVRELSREALLSTPVDYVLPMLDEPVDAARMDALLPSGAALLAIEADLLARPGPRLLDGAEALCAALADAP